MWPSRLPMRHKSNERQPATFTDWDTQHDNEARAAHLNKLSVNGNCVSKIIPFPLSKTFKCTFLE